MASGIINGFIVIILKLKKMLTLYILDIFENMQLAVVKGKYKLLKNILHLKYVS